MRICHYCQQTLDKNLSVYRSSTCPHCAKDLKICSNCRFYSRGAHWDCVENISELVADKERSNFCDYFQFSRSTGGESTSAKPAGSEKARNDFKKLFGNGQ